MKRLYYTDGEKIRSGLFLISKDGDGNSVSYLLSGTKATAKALDRPLFSSDLEAAKSLEQKMFWVVVYHPWWAGTDGLELHRAPVLVSNKYNRQRTIIKTRGSEINH